MRKKRRMIFCGIHEQKYADTALFLCFYAAGEVVNTVTVSSQPATPDRYTTTTGPCSLPQRTETCTGAAHQIVGHGMSWSRHAAPRDNREQISSS